MAFIGGESWFKYYESCENLALEIMENISSRNQQQRNSLQYSRINATVRQLIKKYNTDVTNLKKNLSGLYSSGQITVQEMERRERKLDALESKGRKIENAFNDWGQGENRNELLGTDFGTRPSTSWGMEEAVGGTEDLTVEEMRQQQQVALEQQDQGLDTLYSVVVRQKQMAQNIGDELDLHNEIIDDIIDHADRTGDRLIRETKNVTVVNRKSNTCIYWTIIVLLFIAIVVVVAVPS